MDERPTEPKEEPASWRTLAQWARDVGGSQGINELDTAWTVWAGERQTAQRRAATGRIWPPAEELSHWVVSRVHWCQVEVADFESFTGDLMHSLRKRAKHLEGRFT